MKKAKAFLLVWIIGTICVAISARIARSATEDCGKYEYKPRRKGKTVSWRTLYVAGRMQDNTWTKDSPGIYSDNFEKEEGRQKRRANRKIKRCEKRNNRIEYKERKRMDRIESKRRKEERYEKRRARERDYKDKVKRQKDKREYDRKERERKNKEKKDKYERQRCERLNRSTPNAPHDCRR